MPRKPDPFDRTPLMVQQFVLAAAPLAAAGLPLFWWRDPLWFGLTLSAIAGAATALVLAAARHRQAQRMQGWLHQLSRHQHTSRPRLLSVWDPAIEPLIRPAQRLAVLNQQRGTSVNELEDLVQTLIQAVPDPILLVDENLTVQNANAAAGKALGLRGSGQPIMASSRDPALLAALRDTLDVGTASTLTINIGLEPVLEFAARIEPVQISRQQRGALIALRERTEQLMIERMRSDFIADASHEMRTPMTTILGVIETLQGPAKDDPDAWSMFLDEMAQAGQRMVSLLEDLLSLSSIELQASRAPKDEVSLADLARSVVHDLEPRASQRGIAIELRGADTAGSLTVPGDQRQLRQVMVNLIENAVKYGHPNSDVQVSLEILDHGPNHAGPLTGRACIRFAVHDRGDGIEAEHIPRLTERFYRVDRARSRELGGTGLGLAIVKHILRRHQGHLDIQSEPGVGSCFAGYLPLPARPASEKLPRDTEQAE